MTLTKVVELKVVPPYGLRVRFSNGQAGTHEFGAPTWPNGFDMSPEWLRREMLAAGELSASAA